MKVRRHNSLNSLLATLLVVVAAAGCVEPIDITPPEVTDDVELTFQIAVPSAGIMTKADTDIASVGDESKIYDLQVWAFTNGGAASETAVGYGHLTSTDGSIPTITMKLPSRVVNGIAEPNKPDPTKLDFYALANGPSVEFNPVKYPMRSALQGATFGDGDGAGFGTECVSAVPNETDYKGLPMACYSAANFDVTFLRYGFTDTQLRYIDTQADKEIKADEQDPADPFNIEATGLAATPIQKTYLSGLTNDGVNSWMTLWAKLCPTLELKRSIAKIRFVFAKAASMTVTTAEEETPINTEIISISLIDKETPSTPKKVLPKETYLFPRETGTAIRPPSTAIEPEDDYDAFNWTGDNGNSLVPSSSFDEENKTIDTPLRLRWDEYQNTHSAATLSGYSKFLNDEIKDGHAIDKVLYLRESDKTDIYARINFKIGNNTGSTDIRIPDGAKFLRNSWWTVYAYFISYELGFQVTVAPWDGIGSSPNDNSHLQ
jgi:hypothetical protein